MRPKRHSQREQSSIRLDCPVAVPKSCPATRFSPVQSTRRKLLLTLLAAGSLLAESIAMTGESVAQVSSFEYQVMKLKAESARFEREKNEQVYRQETENSRVATYNGELLRVVSEFQKHIADQHQHLVSCKTCRQLTKQMSELSKKIERGVR
jgi:hypothetical protein